MVTHIRPRGHEMALLLRPEGQEPVCGRGARREAAVTDLTPPHSAESGAEWIAHYDGFNVRPDDVDGFYIQCRRCHADTACYEIPPPASRADQDVRLSDLIRWADQHTCADRAGGSA